MDFSEIKDVYQKRRDEIQERLDEFSKIRGMDIKDIFAEFCFCLLTPQSKARNCWSSILALKASGALYSGRKNNIEHVLHKKVRFHKNKSKYIIENRRHFFSENPEIIGVLKKNSNDAREWLVENVKGYGYKEASHFLRNIGFNGLSILDRHIIKNLYRAKWIDEVPKTLDKKKYLEIENRFQQFSNKVGIPIDHLDLLFWSMETGEIFK